MRSVILFVSLTNSRIVIAERNCDSIRPNSYFNHEISFPSVMFPYGVLACRKVRSTGSRSYLKFLKQIPLFAWYSISNSLRRRFAKFSKQKWRISSTRREISRMKVGTFIWNMLQITSHNLQCFMTTNAMKRTSLRLS